jgi:hypothetical protein
MFVRFRSMTFRTRLVSIAQWRWMTSVGVIAAACLPMAGAILLIPSEIGAPRTLRQDTRNSDAPANAQPAAVAPAKRELGTNVPSATPTALPGAKSVSTPKATQSSPTTEHSRLAALHGSFVPAGEADDSAPLEARRIR